MLNEIPGDSVSNMSQPGDAVAGAPVTQNVEPAIPAVVPEDIAPAASNSESTPPNPLADAPLSVLLLAHNEGAELEDTAVAWIEFLRGLGRAFEVILVDDGGNDGAQIDQLAQRFSEVRVVRHETSQGLGASLRDGLALAQHPLVFYTRCNQQYQPADLNKLLEQILNVEVAAGCRVGGKVPWWLRIVDFCHRMFCLIVFGLPIAPRPTWLGWTAFKHRLIARWLFGLRFHDPECAFSLFRREVFRRIPIQSQGDFAPVEILAKANFLVTSGAEIPVSYVPRGPAGPILREALKVFREPDFGPVK